MHKENVKVAVLSNTTCDEIENFIQEKLTLENISCSVYLSKYNLIYADILDKNSALYKFDPHFVLLLLDEKIILEKLPAPWNINDIKTVCEEVNDLIKELISEFQKNNSRAMFVLSTLVFSKKTLSQLIDYRSKSLAFQYLNNINQFLFNLSLVNTNFICLDSNVFLQDENVYLQDSRLAFYAGMGFHSSLLEKISGELINIIKARSGLSKKLLVLDLDNTLWGGVLGDDGIENIKLGGEYEGQAYQYFQKIIKQLNSQGVLLAISSKNELDNVEKAFSQHPEMHLKNKDFVNIKANWLPKHENILCIQQDINIGGESIVFVDDSAFECESIKKFLPDISAILLPEDPILFSDELLSRGLFNKLNLTEEDINRTNNYLSENQRKNYSKKFGSYESFLIGLRIYLRVFIPDIYQSERVSQLSLRTNQFNMTGAKFTADEIKRMTQQNNFKIIAVDYEDKFGKNGLIAAVILEIINEINLKKLVIRNFLLSCRVFSRGVENALMTWIVNYAKKMSISEIIGIYIPMPKNIPAKDFYLINKFKNDPNNIQHYLLSDFENHECLKNTSVILIDEVNINAEEKIYATA